MDAFPRFVITAKEARAGIVTGRMHMRSKRRRTAQSPAIGRKRIVARRGRSMMFIVLWLTGARRNYFRS